MLPVIAVVLVLAYFGTRKASAPATQRSPYLDLRPIRAAAQPMHIALSGQALMNFAWTQLAKYGGSLIVPQTYAQAIDPNVPQTDFSQIPAAAMIWRNLYILGNLQNPAVMSDPDAANYWTSCTAENPFFSHGAQGSKAMGWG